MMKRIGFIDYYLDEWHANQYPAMIEAHNRQYGTDYCVQYAWAESDAVGEGKLSSAAWCERHGVTCCATIEELCAKSDCVIVLAPSDPDKHLAYATRIFQCGKSPYIDKSFAPDLATAQQIFALAKEHRVRFFSTSALRYAEELLPYRGSARSISTTGGGSNFEEYIIHQIEMVVTCLGCGAVRVRRTEETVGERLEVVYADGRSATMLFAPELPFAAIVNVARGGVVELPIKSAFFASLIGAILRFFETGEPPFDGAETLEVMRIRDAVLRARSVSGTWQNISR